MERISSVPQAPADPIFSVATKYNASPLSEKYILSVGVYRTEEGKPYIFPSVQKAEERLIAANPRQDKDYLPMTGNPTFIKSARQLLWGDDILAKDGKRIASVQSCAGTGALNIISVFAKNFLKPPAVLISKQAWPNYSSVFGDQGHSIQNYEWAKDGSLDLEGCLSSLRAAPEGSLLVLQASAHNPTGVDPTHEQFQKIFEVAESKKHIITFDFAYMGFASGDMEEDAKVVRDYAKRGAQFFVAFSFSKIMGLYAERIGCLHFICKEESEVPKVSSQFGIITRGTVSVPPKWGSLIVSEILDDPELRKQWVAEFSECSKRIINIRNKLCELLEKKTEQSWDFLRRQKGMFAYTGLSQEEVKILGDREGVFIVGSGRISVPALNNKNVEFISQGIANVVKERKKQ